MCRQLTDSLSLCRLLVSLCCVVGLWVSVGLAAVVITSPPLKPQPSAAVSVSADEWGAGER